MDSSDDGDQIKTVYAHFGLSVYLAQCLEHELVNGLALLELMAKRTAVASKQAWEAMVDEIMDRHFEHTLGRMIRDLKQVTSIPTGLEASLIEALQKRNWLIHNYFRERAVDFMTPAGREKMIEELEAAQDLFRKADRDLQAVNDPLQVKFGITEERIQQLLNETRVQFLK